MSSRWYPIYRKGNPQLRVFLPNFWLKLVKPDFKQPNNVVKFITSIEMTDHDIKNYLEKLYKIPVAHVRSEIVEGEFHRDLIKKYVKKNDDFRRAYVTLKEGETFEFPDITTKKEKEDESEEKKYRQQIELSNKDLEKKSKDRIGLPPWFSL